jgi:predicted amidophosphoribosyltransferase
MIEHYELNTPGYSLGYYIPSGKDITQLSSLFIECKHNTSREIVSEFSHWAGEELLKRVGRIDIIVRALRSHETKVNQQTALDILGHTLAGYLKAVYRPEVVKKTRMTHPLKKIEWTKRKTEIENVYYIDRGKLFDNISVLIIDDIYTTGATIHEIIRALKASGATMSVYFFTLGKTSFEPDKNKDVSIPCLAYK